MSSIEKLAIRGIRSFSQEREQTIEFFTPLTMIIGANGCGKTTIIECLKASCTGSLPPDSRSGQNFIHDPKIDNVSEVKGSIKLRFRNRAGQIMVCIRSYRLQQKKKSLTFKAYDGLIRTQDGDGNTSTISNKCSELDKQLPHLLGVSKAVLDNVIFCHQYESNWPLQEGSILKKKFDDIFESSRYAKALDNIKKLKTTYSKELNEIKIEMASLDERLVHVRELNNSYEEENNDLIQLNEEINILDEEIEMIINEMNELKNELNEVNQYEKEKNLIELNIKSIKSNINNKKRKINNPLYENNTYDELNDELNNYDRDISRYEQENRKIKNLIQEKNNERYNLIEEKKNQLNQEKKLNNELNQYQHNLKERYRIITKLIDFGNDENNEINSNTNNTNELMLIEWPEKPNSMNLDNNNNNNNNLKKRKHGQETTLLNDTNIKLYQINNDEVEKYIYDINNYEDMLKNKIQRIENESDNNLNIIREKIIELKTNLKTKKNIITKNKKEIKNLDKDIIYSCPLCNRPIDENGYDNCMDIWNNINTDNNNINEKEKQQEYINNETNRLENEINECNNEINNINIKINEYEDKISKFNKNIKNDKLNINKKISFIHHEKNNLERIHELIISSNYDNEDNNLINIQNELNKINNLIENKENEIDSLKNENDKIKEKIYEKEKRKNDLKENITYYELLNDLSNEEEKLNNIINNMSNIIDLDEKRKKYNKLEKLKEKKRIKKGEYKGRKYSIKETIKKITKKLNSKEYKNIEELHRNIMIEHETTRIVVTDLDNYFKALDTSLMQYHHLKIDEINKIIKELWQYTYMGEDIDQIEILSGEDNSSNRAKRSYNYRVIMKKGDVTLDMKGRCSAGQRVLASIVIRLALAETFCLNCGILALDEPTTNLDSENKRGLAHALARIIASRSRQNNFQLVVITHDEEFVSVMRGELNTQSGFSMPEYYWRISREELPHEGSGKFYSRIERIDWEDM